MFSPEKNELIHLNDIEMHPMGKLLQNYPSTNFLGEKMDHDLTLSIARGSVDPITRKPYDIILKEHSFSRS